MNENGKPGCFLIFFMVLALAMTGCVVTGIGSSEPKKSEPLPYDRCKETVTHTCTWAGQPVLKKKYWESQN